VFVIGLWSKGSQEIPFINAKSWPHTERLSYTTGETIHWRVLNPSNSDHAMHLHGFFFTVDGVGDGERFETYSQEQQRLAVTEHIDIGRVFDMTWKPDREGNWLFHCHMVAHMEPLQPAEAKQATAEHVHDSSLGMGGLILGITVLPGARPAALSSATNAPHKLQLVISDNPDKIPLYKVEVADPATPSPADSKRKPPLLGPPIVLVRGEPAEIEVKNQSRHETTIH
jgi:manganese oxidase